MGSGGGAFRQFVNDDHRIWTARKLDPGLPYLHYGTRGREGRQAGVCFQGWWVVLGGIEGGGETEEVKGMR